MAAGRATRPSGARRPGSARRLARTSSRTGAKCPQHLDCTAIRRRTLRVTGSERAPRAHRRPQDIQAEPHRPCHARAYREGKRGGSCRSLPGTASPYRCSALGDPWARAHRTHGARAAIEPQPLEPASTLPPPPVPHAGERAADYPGVPPRGPIAIRVPTSPASAALVTPCAPSPNFGGFRRPAVSCWLDSVDGDVELVAFANSNFDLGSAWHRGYSPGIPIVPV
jgi:hypothetical protein